MVKQKICLKKTTLKLIQPTLAEIDPGRFQHLNFKPRSFECSRPFKQPLTLNLWQVPESGEKLEKKTKAEDLIL